MLVLFGWIVVGQTLGVLAGSLIYEGNFLEAISDPSLHPDIRYAILFSQGIGSAIGLIFLPWYYLKVFEHRSLSGFFKQESDWLLMMVLLLAGVVGLALTISPLVEWNANFQFPEWLSAIGRWAKEMEANAAEIIESITVNMTPLAFLISFLVVAVLPAVGEELLFRGVIQTEMVRALKNPHIAIWITSILFSALHFQFLGFVPRMFIGAFLGYLYYWSGNLWVPVLAHFFNNGIQLVGLYLFQKGLLSFDVESTERAPWPMVAAAAVLLLSLLFYLKNYFATRSSSTRDLS